MPESPPRRRLPTPPPPPLSDFIAKSPGLTVHCPGCQRQVGFAFSALVALAGATETIDGLKRRMRCVACGRRGAATTIAWCRPGWGLPMTDART